MAKILKIKLSFIAIFFIAMLFNYEQILDKSTETIHAYTNLTFMVASICFGIIFSTSAYNFVLFKYLRSKQHLYYALAQFFTLMFLINLDSLFISPFDEVFGLKSRFLFDASQILMLFFSLLFMKEFLSSYIKDRLHSLINALLYITLFDFIFTLFFSFSIVTKFIPIFIPIWLVLSEANRLTKDKDIPFYYLLFGWGFVLLIVGLEYVGVRDYFGMVFPFLHVALALDSILLSFAISYKFKLIEDDRRVQQSLLLQQSRLASMGEMIAVVAHQWRQPLSYLSFALMNIKKKTTGAEETINDASDQLQYMSTTIENFRNFYNPAKKKEEFDIGNSCKSCINLISSSVPFLKITIKKNFIHNANKNEFEQVILNIVNNAKDILMQREIKDPKIEIIIDKPTIEIRDNAGGIEKENLDKIFEPYFSTKKENDGIGLYIAKTIIEKEMGGKLTVTNKNNGASFIISFTNNE